MRLHKAAALMLLVSGCGAVLPGSAAPMCQALADEADTAAEALLRPHTPDDVVEDVEPLITGFDAGCGR